MKLTYSTSSPFVRKVMVVAAELGLSDHIERIAAKAHPINRNEALTTLNPLGKVPALITDDELVLFDSSVICQYLCGLAGKNSLLPQGDAARWSMLRNEALADGILDAGLLIRYELTLRTDEQRLQGWMDGQRAKMEDGLKLVEEQVPTFSAEIDLGQIAIACMCGYLDFRFPDLPWRTIHPKTAAWFERLSERPSFAATVPFMPA
jgi:glutathione S-transferase